MRVLFLIHDLGPGGAEKVLVNLVNAMDRERFDITVMTLFDTGVNRQFLAPHIHYQSCFPKDFPGNSHVMKLFTPEQLYRMLIHEEYDVVISYLEGPSARVVSGCPKGKTKVVNWIHIQMESEKEAAVGFRSKEEAIRCYGRADSLVFVSRDVQKTFLKWIPVTNPGTILYNTNQTEKILSLGKENPENLIRKEGDGFHWCGVGKLIPRKGFDRMIRIQSRLEQDGLESTFHILGDGPERERLQSLVSELNLEEKVVFHGYQTNPYQYLSKCDLLVCASNREGFSTAVTEALILGLPVCALNCGGMKEILGEKDEYGVVVEDEEALFSAVKSFASSPERIITYRNAAKERGKNFRAEETVNAVEKFLMQWMN